MDSHSPSWFWIGERLQLNGTAPVLHAEGASFNPWHLCCSSEEKISPWTPADFLPSNSRWTVGLCLRQLHCFCSWLGQWPFLCSCWFFQDWKIFLILNSLWCVNCFWISAGQSIAVLWEGGLKKAYSSHFCTLCVTMPCLLSTEGSPWDCLQCKKDHWQEVVKGPQLHQWIGIHGWYEFELPVRVWDSNHYTTLALVYTPQIIRVTT